MAVRGSLPRTVKFANLSSHWYRPASGFLDILRVRILCFLLTPLAKIIIDLDPSRRDFTVHRTNTRLGGKDEKGNNFGIILGLVLASTNVGAKDVATPQVTAGDYYTVGLKYDGTALAVGLNNYGQCNVESWTDNVQIDTGGGWHTVGLKASGTVVAVGANWYGQCDVYDWRLSGCPLFSLIDLMMGMNLQQGISNSLDVKLQAAMNALGEAN